MVSRALGMATALLVMSFATVPAQAQNLESGKSPSQMFAGSCAACHKSPRGLLKSVPPGSLPGFLRQHYTTGPDMASMLSAYVISNGAADPRGGGGLTRQGQDLVAPRRPADPRPGAAPAVAAPAPREESTGFFGFGRRAEPPQEAAKPDEPPMTARQKRAADRAARRAADRATRPEAVAPAVAPEPPRPAVLGEPPVPIEGAPVRPSKQKASKKGRRGQEQPKPAVTEPAKPEPKEDVRPVARPAEEIKPEPRPEPAQSEPRPERRPEPARSEPAEAAPLRADPVPPVTPAPRAEPETRPAPAAEPSTPAPAAPAAE